jgi:hypothetical protein
LTREAVGLLIERKTGVHLSPRTTISDDLHFTPQRPVKRAMERCEAAVQVWRVCDYPAIQARARAEGAEIHWGDETGVSSQANYGCSFAPEGQTPIILRPARRLMQLCMKQGFGKIGRRYPVVTSVATADLA